MVSKSEQNKRNLIYTLFEGDIEYIHNTKTDALNKAYDVLFQEVIRINNIPNRDAS